MRAVCGKDAGEGQESTHSVEHIPNSGMSRSFAEFGPRADSETFASQTAATV